MQLHFKINSETITFSMFLPRLADPVPGCCSLSTSLLILSQAPALCLQVGDEDEIWCTPPVTCKFCGNETFLCCKSYWRPSYLNLLLRERKSCPDESLSIEMSARFHNNWAIYCKMNYLSFKMNAIDDVLFQELWTWIIFTFLFRLMI